MGFEYDALLVKRPAEVYLRAFQRYKELYGHTRVPQSFTIREGNERFDQEFWGINLGHVRSHIRNNGSHADYKEQWKALGLFD